MKTKKLKLSELQVKSFVTGIQSVNSAKIHGGGGTLDATLTGIYPTVPVDYCIANGSNGYNCPTENGALCN